MGWAVGWDAKTNRWRGYGVPAYCEDPGCTEEINRGLSYACGGLGGCGRFFCEDHLYYDCPEDRDCGKDHSGDNEAVCKRCLDGLYPYPLKPEHPKWVEHILTDDSWAQWRSEEPETVLEYQNGRKE